MEGSYDFIPDAGMGFVPSSENVVESVEKKVTAKGHHDCADSDEVELAGLFFDCR